MAYLFPYACFTCRKSFKRELGEPQRKCPHCGGKAVILSRKFKAPAKDDLKQWKKVEELYLRGFRFEGGTYPKTLVDMKRMFREMDSAPKPRRKPPLSGWWRGQRHSRRKASK
jgi:DNA-directed RNA polymerase subunit RPC12/RpoP